MILLTGASGFLGKHLLRGLIDKHGREKILALSSAQIAGVRTVLRPDTILPGDIFTSGEYGQITAVIHAGAAISKAAAEGNDWQRYNQNILHTQSLLEALPHSVRHFINISTLDVYGACAPIREECPVAPQTMYGLSKYYCERMAEAWAVSSGAVVQNLRLGHVYGPGEEAYKKIIPETFRRILSGAPLQLWGEGTELRSFIYVGDVVNAVIRSLELEQYEGPINIAGGRKISIRELIYLMLEVSGISGDIVRHAASGPPRDITFDNAKMQRLLGDETVSLTEGLRQEWLHMKAAHEQDIL